METAEVTQLALHKRIQECILGELHSVTAKDEEIIEKPEAEKESDVWRRAFIKRVLEGCRSPRDCTRH